MKENEIVKKIRVVGIRHTIGWLIFGLPFNIGFFALINSPDSNSLIWVAFVFALVFDILLIMSIRLVINPLSDPVFKKYGSPEDIKKILNNLNNNKIYEDKNIIMSDKYITNKHDITDLIAFDDVLGVHKYKTTKVGLPYDYGVVLTDKYGIEHTYGYGVINQKDCDKLLEMTAKLCKKAALGYTKEQKQYIKENKKSLEENHNKSNSITIDQKYSNLNKLKDLLDKNIITKEEFENEKKKILNNMR